MIEIKNGGLCLKVQEDNGLICGLYTGLGNYNIADRNGMGGFCCTRRGQDIRTERMFTPYAESIASYDRVEVRENVVRCQNREWKVEAAYTLMPDRLILEACSRNPQLSQFGLDLNLNFLSKKNGSYLGQLLPSSPFTSRDGDKMYCIMPLIGCGFCVVLAKTPCKGWKIRYSEYSFGHFIQGFEMLASLDDRFDPEDRDHICIEIVFAKTVEECYRTIQQSYGCPMLYSTVTGTFGNDLELKLLGDADEVAVYYGAEERRFPVEGKQIRIASCGYGRHQVVPYQKGQAGLDTVLWFGEDMEELFRKSCDRVRKPYHCDANLCEGMVWCWSLLSYMVSQGSSQYLDQVDAALGVVMGQGQAPVPGNTILPYALDGAPAYHIYQSRRIQEQFYGISILLERYRLDGEMQYLTFAVHAAETMVRCYQKENGAFVPHSDYTTVCAPVIPLVDLSVALRGQDEEKSLYFAESAGRAAAYLVRRGLHFPTEGIASEENDEEMEEGSISCTALSILYYCRYIKYQKEYVEFAEEVLKLHDWWRCYTPDVRLYMSTMRWWETIWEGDGTGPAICGGHAWAIWRAEADFHMAVLKKRPEYFISSWNGFMTNFSKITAEGESFSCYQPDYFTGGGDPAIRRFLQQLSEEDLDKRYEIAHGYPRHTDHSLSRYVWVRFCATWRRTAVAILWGDEVVELNCRYENGRVISADCVEECYLFENGVCRVIRTSC